MNLYLSWDTNHICLEFRFSIHSSFDHSIHKHSCRVQKSTLFLWSFFPSVQTQSVAPFDTINIMRAVSILTTVFFTSAVLALPANGMSTHWRIYPYLDGVFQF